MAGASNKPCCRRSCCLESQCAATLRSAATWNDPKKCHDQLHQLHQFIISPSKKGHKIGLAPSFGLIFNMKMDPLCSLWHLHVAFALICWTVLYFAPHGQKMHESMGYIEGFSTNQSSPNTSGFPPEPSLKLPRMVRSLMWSATGQNSWSKPQQLTMKLMWPWPHDGEIPRWMSPGSPVTHLVVHHFKQSSSSTLETPSLGEVSYAKSDTSHFRHLNGVDHSRGTPTWAGFFGAGRWGPNLGQHQTWKTTHHQPANHDISEPPMFPFFMDESHRGPLNFHPQEAGEKLRYIQRHFYRSKLGYETGRINWSLARTKHSILGGPHFDPKRPRTKYWFPKSWGYPQSSSISIGFSPIFTNHFGILHLWNHPNDQPETNSQLEPPHAAWLEGNAACRDATVTLAGPKKWPTIMY